MSPHLQASYKIEKLCEYYDQQILVSETLYNLMSLKARNTLRKIDVISMKKEQKPCARAMAGIFKTFSPKLSPMHLHGVSGDSMSGKPDDCIGYVAEGGLTGQYSPDKFPLTPELEAKGLTKEQWAKICESLAEGKGMTGLDGGFSKAIAKANEDFLDNIGCIGAYAEYGKGQKCMVVLAKDAAGSRVTMP